jgi:hypothetical protein
MVFKNLDCFFGLVVPVVVWRYKLVSHLVELDCCLKRAEHSLSRMCSRGKMLVALRQSIRA